VNEPVWVYFPKFGFRPGFLLDKGAKWSRVKTRLGTKVGEFRIRKVKNEQVTPRGPKGVKLEGER
jgi:hypothetical protein